MGLICVLRAAGLVVITVVAAFFVLIAAKDESRNDENVFDSKVFLFNIVRDGGGVGQHGLHRPTRYHTRCVFETSVVKRIVFDCVGELFLTLSYHATIAASPTQRA